MQEKLREMGLETLYYDVELPLCAVLARMEHEGVAADQFALMSFGQMLSERIEDTQAAVYRYAGEEFNINSTKKLGEILFDRLGLPPVKKTKAATPPMRRSSKSCGPGTPSFRACLTTGC